MEAYLTYLRIHIWFSIVQWLLNALMMEKNLWSLSDMTFTPKTYLKVKNLTLHLGICLNFVPFSRFWIHVKNYLLGESIHMLVHKNNKLDIRRDYGFVKLDASGTKVSFNISDLKSLRLIHKLVWFQISYIFSDNAIFGDPTGLQYELKYNCHIGKIESVKSLKSKWQFSTTYFSEGQIVSDFWTKGGNHISFECQMEGQNCNELLVST